MEIDWEDFETYPRSMKSEILWPVVRRILQKAESPLGTYALVDEILRECDWLPEENGEERFRRNRLIGEALRRFPRNYGRKSNRTYESDGRLYHHWEWSL